MKKKKKQKYILYYDGKNKTIRKIKAPKVIVRKKRCTTTK